MDQAFSLSQESIRTVFDFRASLTAYGFEAYITDFFRHGDYRFRTIQNRGYDHGAIDVQGVRDEDDGSRTHIFVGCQKWDGVSIGEEDILRFYRDTLLLPEYDQVQLVYVTMTGATLSARDVCRERGIVLIDRDHLVDLDREFPLSAWIAEVSDREDYTEITTDWYRVREQARWEVRYETQREITILRNELQSFSGIVQRWFGGGKRVA